MGNEKDFFRDTNVRYLGYANEVGESFRPLVSRRVVIFSYQVAFLYVLADTADKGFKMLRHDGRLIRVAVATGDALIWQTLASVIIPGFTINRIVHYTGRALQKREVAPVVRKFGPVAVGLASIPIIIRPIDHAVTVFMNLTYRALFGLPSQ